MNQERNLTLKSSDLVLMGHSGILVHHKGIILYANPYAAKKAGFSHVEDFIGLDIRNFIHPDDLPKIMARIEDMYANGTHYDDLDERFLDKNGDIIYVDVSVKPVDYEGKPSILMVANDVTHHKKAEHFKQQTSNILSMVASGVVASDVYHAVCIMHENKYPHMRSSILKLQGQQLFHGASPSLPQTYSQAIDGAEIGACAGSCGTAAFLGKEVIV
ncbi:MAG: PAS domain S-box protein, partial [Mariprofundaceae bacterium]|nr:PAS domain S-box protein [Mariprofundaceae bacterium]